jgi:hypothetical protein
MKKINFTQIYAISASLALAVLLGGGCTPGENEDSAVHPQVIQVIYDLNGGTGTAPVDPNSYSAGNTVTTLDGAGLTAPVDTTFYGWSTSADGYGHVYAAGAAFTITGNTTLYALWNGDGTNALYPKLISTKAELTALTQHDHAALIADISGVDTVIPGPDTVFEGTFDGRGHTVTVNLTSAAGNVFFGLFRTIYGNAVVKNLHVTGAINLNVTGSDSRNFYAGGIAGASMGAAKLRNCVSTVNLTVNAVGSPLQVGGLVGAAATGIDASYCNFSGTIHSTSPNSRSGDYHNAGGIVGGASLSSNIPVNISRTVSLYDITWENSARAYAASNDGARGIMGGLGGGTLSGTISDNYALGRITMRDKNGDVTTQSDQASWDGTTIDPASDVDSETWWRTTAGWETVWGGDNPTTDKPWVWDAVAKRPKLHKFD